MACGAFRKVKRYLLEVGTAWVRRVADPQAGDTVIVGQLTKVEAAAALAARHRAGTITPGERDAAVALLLRHFDAQYLVVPLSDAVVEQAVRRTQQHRLRGYDAVQLALALDAHVTTAAAGLPALTFVAADDDLLAAARAEGLAAENPNQHP